MKTDQTPKRKVVTRMVYLGWALHKNPPYVNKGVGWQVYGLGNFSTLTAARAAIRAAHKEGERSGGKVREPKNKRGRRLPWA
jgi:hypothetical protein